MSAPVYVIAVTLRGKPHRRRFRTLALAQACASEIHTATGIVVGIEQESR